MRFVRERGVGVREPSPSRFTAGVLESEILEAVSDGGMRAHRFVYPPRGRSSWHTHEGEQALFVLVGRGAVARWGVEEVTFVEPGDWVHVEPGEKHWHGATPSNLFVHIAVTASGGTQWHEPVGESEYAAALDR